MDMIPIPAVAVKYSSKALLKWKGRQGSRRANSRLLQGDLFQVVLRSREIPGVERLKPVGEPAVPGIIPGGVASKDLFCL